MENLVRRITRLCILRIDFAARDAASSARKRLVTHDSVSESDYLQCRSFLTFKIV